MPSTARNFFGNIVDRILPGQNYNAQTGHYTNVGTGLAGLGARIAGTMLAGPAAGALIGKAAGYLIDRNGQPQISPEAVEGTQNVNVSLPGYSVSQPTITSNLGLGAQTPGNAWAGYMQSPGSINNFGNNQFGTGTASQAGSWSPSSVWGQVVASNKPANPGSIAGFGNNVGGFVSGSMGGNSGGFTDAGSRSKGNGWQTVYQRGA